MPIRAPDINANYLQIRNLEMVRGDTFGLKIRLIRNNQPEQLGEVGVMTFAVFDTKREAVIKINYTGTNTIQDSDGYINIALTPAETSLLRKSEKYTYEVEWVINSDTVYTLLKGDIKVIADSITTENRGETSG